MFPSAATRRRILEALPPRIGTPLNLLWIDARRWMRFERADVCLVSYPKAGRTWLRMLVGRALELHFGLSPSSPLELEQFADLDRRMPRILVTHDDVTSRSRPGDLRQDRRRYRRKRVVLLVRDPRDVLVSRYFHVTRRERREQTLPDFMRDCAGGYDTILEFHRIWARNLTAPAQLHLVRYEDMARDARTELRKVVDFLGFGDMADTTLEEAVAYASFDNMRNLEAADALASHRLRAAVPNDPESFKVRRGKVGGFGDYLNPADVKWLTDRLHAAGLERFGYGSSREAIPDIGSNADDVTR